jgi:spore germination protein YaaH
MSDAQSFGFDGINMDIELTDAKLSRTGPHYVQFLRELSIACHKAGLSLSVDVPPPTESNKGFDIEELGYVCDYLVLMAYDEHYAGSEPGSVASLPFVEKSITDVLEKYHFPAAKLVCGVPFYTRLWRIEGSDVKSDAISMGKAKDWIGSKGVETLWRDEEGQYFAEYVDGTATYRMWQEEEESIRAKLGVIRAKGVNSVAAWKLGLESDGIWTLMDSAMK